MVVSRDSNRFATIWDAWLIQVIIMSFSLALFDTASRNILAAWVLCCFDTAFIMDACVRGYHKAYRILDGSLKIRTKNVLAINSFKDVLSSWLHVFGFVSLIPYHFLFLLQMDTVVFYSIICLMRLVWIYQAQRSCFAYLKFNVLKRSG